MTTSSAVHWTSRFTFLMAAIGCSVGLGNIWRFPYSAGVNGGGAFVLVYFAAVIVLALPILMAELLIGRRGANSPPLAIATVATESGRSANWRWMGILLGGIGAITVLAFYSVVGGWTLAYTFKMGAGQFQGISAASAGLVFEDLTSSPAALLAWFTLFIGLTIFISARGLHAGVERATSLMMPALFLMLLAMVIYAAVVGDFAAALRFLFRPDFEKLNATIVLGAFGQAFFSVSVGITNLMAYGAYLEQKTRLPQASAIIAGADTLVAILAGLAIFPIIFAYGLEPGAGPGLVFITLPFAFGQIPGGHFFGAVFFVLLFFAALTSSIAMMEPPVSWLTGTTSLSRRSAALLSGSISFVLGVLAALSFNVLGDVHPLGAIPIFSNRTFFDLFDYFVTNLLMPSGGILIAVFAGWIVKRHFTADELFGGQNTLAYRIWLFLVRYLAPAVLAYVLFDMATS
jgi:neurotransmitter:Na+ symporter, NSS family